VKEEEKKKMITTAKPVKSTEIVFETDREFEKFMEIIRNPAKPSKYVKEIFKAYQQKKRGK
jgi:uncharacterized protein (DUF1778 family)